MRNTKSQGNAGVGAAISYFTSADIMVAVPLADNQPYDLVIEIDNNLKKVQVKTTTRRKLSGSWEVQIKTCGGNQSWNRVCKLFDNTTVDYMFVLTGDGRKYLIPTAEITSKRMLTINESHRKFEVFDIKITGD